MIKAAVKDHVWLLDIRQDMLAPYRVPSILMGVFAYVPPMLKWGADVSWWRAVLSTPPFIVGLLLAHFIYRALQFVIGFSMIA